MTQSFITNGKKTEDRTIQNYVNIFAFLPKALNVENKWQVFWLIPTSDYLPISLF